MYYYSGTAAPALGKLQQGDAGAARAFGKMAGFVGKMRFAACVVVLVTTTATVHAGDQARDQSSFESDWDGWTTSTFLRNTRSTAGYDGNTYLYAETGPTYAADGSYYVYAETSSPNYPEVKFKMYRDYGADLASVTFQYSMYGDVMGTVELKASSDGSSYTTIWSKSGNQGNRWETAVGKITGSKQWLRFVYESGSSYTGDFALDDVVVTYSDAPSAYPTVSSAPTSSLAPTWTDDYVGYDDDDWREEAVERPNVASGQKPE